MPSHRTKKSMASGKKAAAHKKMMRILSNPKPGTVTLSRNPMSGTFKPGGTTTKLTVKGKRYPHNQKIIGRGPRGR